MINLIHEKFPCQIESIEMLKGKLQKNLLLAMPLLHVGVYKTRVQGAASRISNVNIVMQINSKRKYEKYKLKI